jgi:hypothetical protein
MAKLSSVSTETLEMLREAFGEHSFKLDSGF